jgi:hypothetical protein
LHIVINGGERLGPLLRGGMFFYKGRVRSTTACTPPGLTHAISAQLCLSRLHIPAGSRGQTLRYARCL